MPNNINTRIKNKIDTEENWKKATNFIPLEGEQIIYKKDDKYDYERIKIGDGVTPINDLKFIFTQPDYNQQNPLSPDFIKNKTHYKETLSKSIDWDGIGRYNSITNNEGFTYYKVQEPMSIDYDLLYDNYYYLTMIMRNGFKISINHNNKGKYGGYIETDGTNLVVYAETDDNYLLPYLFNIISVPCSFSIGGQSYNFEGETGLYFIKMPRETEEDDYIKSLSLNLYNKLDNAYLDDNILTRENKLSDLYGNLSNYEQEEVRKKIGAGTSNFSGDFNDLINLPFYPSPFNITWDGNTTDLVYTTTTEITGLGAVLYYQLYNISPDSNIVEGSKVTMIAGDTPYTLVVMSENIIDDGNNNYHLLFPAFNELVPLVFCISTPDTITIESNGASFIVTFDQMGVYLINSFGSYISEFYKESKKLDEELLPDIVLGKNKCPQLSIGLYDGGYVYDYISYSVLSNLTNAYYDSITSDSFTIPVFMNDNATSTNGTVSFKIVTGIDSSSLSISRYVDVQVEISKLYYGKSYLVLASKQSDGSWKGKVVGNVDIPIDSSPTSDSENLITSGGVYTAINEAIGRALGGSY